MNKRGQLTFMVAAGIVLVIAVALMLSLQQRTGVISDDFRPVQGVVQQCLDNHLRSAIVLVAYQGGMMYPPQSAITALQTRVPYWYTPAGRTDPGADSLKTDIANYMFDTMDACVPGTVEGITITRGKAPTIKVIIGAEDETVIVTFPLTLQLGDRRETLQDFVVRSTLPLGSLLRQGRAVIDKLVLDRTGIDATALLAGPAHADIYNQTRLDKIIALQQGDLVLNFAVKLAEHAENKPPVLQEVPTIILGVGETVHVQVRASDPEGGPLTYDIISNDFTISPDGMLEIVGTTAGTYSPTVRIEDDTGQAIYTDIQVMVR